MHSPAFHLVPKQRSMIENNNNKEKKEPNNCERATTRFLTNVRFRNSAIYLEVGRDPTYQFRILIGKALCAIQNCIFD